MRTPLLALLLLASVVPALPAQEPKPASPDATTEALLPKVQAGDARALAQVLDLGRAAVPVLTRGLWSDSYTTRRQCAMLLGMIGGDARAAAPSLAHVMKDDSDTKARVEAARALGAVGAYAAIPALRAAIKDETAIVRLMAAQSLIDLGVDANAVLPTLTKAVKSAQSTEQLVAAQLLGELGPEAASAVVALHEALVDADSLATYRIAEALGRIGPGARNAVPLLKSKATLHIGASFFRVPSAIALWRISRDPAAGELLRDSLSAKAIQGLPHEPLWRISPSQKTTEVIARQLKSENPEMVLTAAELLGAKCRDTVPQLLAILKKESEKPEHKLRAMSLLGHIGPDAKDALDTLRPLARSKQLAAAVALYQIEPKPENALSITEFFESKDDRLPAAEALRFLQPKSKAVAVELLIALDSTDEDFRLVAACALWRIEKNPAALKAVAKSLRAASPRVRERAATAIGAEFGPDAKSVVPELARCLFDSHQAVRSSAAESLGRVGPNAKEAAASLVAVLEGDEPVFVQSAACEALGLVQPTDKEAALSVLRPKLEHPAPRVRVHAALALVLVAGDKGGEQEAIRGLGNRSYQVRITAAEALWRMGKDGRSIPLLVRTLEEANLSGTESENERYMAARALGRIGPDAKAAVPELLRLIDAHDPDLAAAARTALKAIDPDKAHKAGVK